MLGRALEPRIGGFGQRVADPVVALLLGRRVDDAGNVARGAEHEALLAAHHPCRGIGRRPGHDVVLARAVDEDRRLDRAEVDLFAADRQRTGLDQFVLQVGVAQVPAVHRARQIGRVAIPVEQVERRRRLALEVVADDIVPDQIVRAQEAEGGGQVLALQQTGATGGLFAERHVAQVDHRLVDEQIEDAGVLEIDQRRQQRHRMRRLLAARRQHRQRGGQQGAADAEPERVQRLGAGDLLHDGQRAYRALGDVVVPGHVDHRHIGVAPAHHEQPVSLLDRVTDERVVGLQVHDVELVDARRHEQHRPLVHLGAQRLVLDQLEQLVLEHHRAFGGRHIAADLERAFVGLRDMALVQVLPELLQTDGDAFALALQRLVLGLGVEREKVARAGGVDPLLHREADARLGLGVALDRVGHLHQRARIQQVHLRRVGRRRIGRPFGRGKAAIGQRRRGRALGVGCEAVQGVVPEIAGILQILALELGQFGQRQAQAGHRFPDIGHGDAQGIDCRNDCGRRLGRGLDCFLHLCLLTLGSFPPRVGLETQFL